MFCHFTVMCNMVLYVSFSLVMLPYCVWAVDLMILMCMQVYFMQSLIMNVLMVFLCICNAEFLPIKQMLLL